MPEIKKNILNLLLLSGLFLSLLNSCSKDENSKPAPELPSFGDMGIDLTFLTSKKDGSIKVSNWQYSVLSVARWHYFLNTVCGVPVTAFQSASGQKASYAGDNKWQWKYQVNTDSMVINTRLTAHMDADSLYWGMYISISKNEVTSDEFLWLKGTSTSNLENGWWIFYESPVNPNSFLRIDWIKNKETRYTFIKPDDSGAGSYLLTGSLSSSDFDAFYTVYGKVHSDFTNIEYNKTTKAGRIKSPLVYGDSNWHYWDSSLLDI